MRPEVYLQNLSMVIFICGSFWWIHDNKKRRIKAFATTFWFYIKVTVPLVNLLSLASHDMRNRTPTLSHGLRGHNDKLTSNLRKWKGEFGSDSFRTHHGNILPMCLNCFFHDRKSKSGTFLIFSTGEVTLVKALPDFPKRWSWNTHTVIFYRGIYFFSAVCRLNRDDGIRITEFNRIVQQVV